MRMSEKCRNNNNNSDYPLISRRTDGGRNDQKIYQLVRKGNQNRAYIHYIRI